MSGLKEVSAGGVATPPALPLWTSAQHGQEWGELCLHHAQSFWVSNLGGGRGAGRSLLARRPQLLLRRLQGHSGLHDIAAGLQGTEKGTKAAGLPRRNWRAAHVLQSHRSVLSNADSEPRWALHPCHDCLLKDA